MSYYVQDDDIAHFTLSSGGITRTKYKNYFKNCDKTFICLKEKKEDS